MASTSSRSTPARGKRKRKAVKRKAPPVKQSPPDVKPAPAPPAQPAGPKTGRPTVFTQECAERLCALLMEGTSLRKAVSQEGMPGKTTVFRWLDQHPPFRDQYARARELWADKVFDEILEIADAAEGDTKPQDLGDGVVVERVDHEHINRSRLRVDARKWVAARLAPKKYGERLDLTHADPDGKALVPVIHLHGRPGPAPAPKAVGGVRKPRD